MAHATSEGGGSETPMTQSAKACELRRGGDGGYYVECNGCRVTTPRQMEHDFAHCPHCGGRTCPYCGGRLTMSDMIHPVDGLVRQHRDLAASIVAGAMDAVAERLTPTDPHVCREKWCDGNSREWKGAHVEALCIGIAAEIKRLCADIVPNK